jgi:predicted MFS family arabinose efflux permease
MTTPDRFYPVWPGFGLVVAAHCLGVMNLLAVLACSPLIAVELDLTAVDIGLIASAYSAALGGLSIPAGRLTDSLGVRLSLFLAAMLIATGALIIAASAGFGAILAGIVLCGAGYSLVNPAAGRAVLQWYPAEWRGTLMGIKQTGVPIGGAIGTTSAVLAPAVGWHAVIGGLGVVTALLGVMFLTLPRDQTTAPVPRRSLRDELDAIGQLFRDPVLGRNNLASGLTNGGQFILWSYLTEFLRLGVGFGLPLANACLTILHLGSVAGRVLWGWLTDRVMRRDSRATLLVLTAIAIAGLLGMALVTPQNALLVVPLLAVALGLTICSATGVQLALTLQSARPEQAGGAIGYNMLVTNIGGVIAPPAFGLVLDLGGGFALAWGLTALGVVFAFALLWCDRKRS